MISRGPGGLVARPVLSRPERAANVRRTGPRPHPRVQRSAGDTARCTAPPLPEELPRQRLSFHYCTNRYSQHRCVMLSSLVRRYQRQLLPISGGWYFTQSPVVAWWSTTLLTVCLCCSSFPSSTCLALCIFSLLICKGMCLVLLWIYLLCSLINIVVICLIADIIFINASLFLSDTFRCFNIDVFTVYLSHVIEGTRGHLANALIAFFFLFQNSSPWWRRSEPPASVCVKSREFKYTFCFMTHNITIVLDLHFSSVCDIN